MKDSLIFTKRLRIYVCLLLAALLLMNLCPGTARAELDDLEILRALEIGIVPAEWIPALEKSTAAPASEKHMCQLLCNAALLEKGIIPE